MVCIRDTWQGSAQLIFIKIDCKLSRSYPKSRWTLDPKRRKTIFLLINLSTLIISALNPWLSKSELWTLHIC